MDAEGEPEPQPESQPGGRSPKRARVEARPTGEAEEGTSGSAVVAPGNEAVGQGEREEEPLVDGAVAVSAVRLPPTSRIPRPVGNPVVPFSSSEVDT